MSRTVPVPQALRLVTEHPTARFLGLSTGERNERIAYRLASAGEPRKATLPTLTIPAGAIITPALMYALPPPNGTWHLRWAPQRQPVVWRGANAQSSNI